MCVCAYAIYTGSLAGFLDHAMVDSTVPGCRCSKVSQTQNWQKHSNEQPIPSDKRLHNYGKSLSSMGKSTN